MTAQLRAVEMNSELVLHDLYLCFSERLCRTYETMYPKDGVYVPKNSTLIKCVANALAKQQSKFDD